MSIPISLLQSQQVINRKELNKLHNELAVELDNYHYFKAMGDEFYVDCTKVYVAKLRKRIARLVKLQKAIKAELQHQYGVERLLNRVRKLRKLGIVE